MSQSIVTGHDHGPDMAVLPEVNIGTTDTGRANVNETLIWAKLGDFALSYPQVVCGAGVDGDVLWLFLEDSHFEIRFFCLV